MVKPFSIAELLARIAAVLRRYPARVAAADAPLRFPGGELDVAAHELAWADGRRSPLTEKEFELFRYFLAHPGRLIPQEELLLRIWGSSASASQSRAVAVTLTRLREKLGAEASAPFENVRGRGYKWNYET